MSRAFKLSLFQEARMARKLILAKNLLKSISIGSPAWQRLFLNNNKQYMTGSINSSVLLVFHTYPSP